MLRLLGPAGLSACLALLVACSPSTSSGQSGASAPPAAGAPAVRGTDALKFEPTSITVKAGQPVTLTFTNAGQIPHDWSLSEGAAQPVKIDAASSQSASATFTIDRPGTYTYICSQPGHEAAGMKGTLTVQ